MAKNKAEEKEEKPEAVIEEKAEEIPAAEIAEKPMKLEAAEEVVETLPKELIKPGETPIPIVTETRKQILNWKPKTGLGKDVLEGKIKSIDEILESGKRIMESEIIDILAPNLKNELILMGGRAGKGGGKQRIPIKITAAMHRSGRKFSMNTLVVVGDENGLVGVGKAAAVESRDSIAKAMRKAKMNLIRIKRGCGSWECGCNGEHSIPYKTKGKSGSVRVELMPAPKGVGLVANDELKKILRLAGIRDIWVKTYGNTKMRLNLIKALFDALRNLYVYER